MDAAGASLAGRAALVTGAGVGIGRASAEALAGAGAFVGIHFHQSAEGANETLAAIQALVRWDPIRFLEVDGSHRAEAGFPPNHPVFRVEGPPGAGDALEAALRILRPVSLLVTTGVGPTGTVCLVTVRPQDLAGFREEVLRLAATDIVTRVEAEPHP